jgi:hypothetical protein
MTHPPEAIEAVARALHAERDFYGNIDTVYPTAIDLLDTIAPMLTAQVVRVKPLVWEEDDRGDWVAKSATGPYRIVQTKSPKDKWHEVTRMSAAYGGPLHDTLEAAKAAAQADYAARILSSVEAVDVSQAVRVKPLVWTQIGNFAMAADDLFNIAAVAADPAAYDAERAARILSSVEAVDVSQAVLAERAACTEELRLAVAAARAAERERAAKVAEGIAGFWSEANAQDIADAIRKLKGGA